MSAAGPALAALLDAARAPLASWPERHPGRRAVGVLCSYVPLEIVHAAGFAPVRVRGSGAALRHVDAHLQSYVCALCRSTLDRLLGGDLDFAAGFIFAHTCDSMQALADLWRLHAPRERFVDVVMQPGSVGSPAARPYLAAELARFRDRLAAFAGRPIADDDVRRSIAVYDETRALVQGLQARRDRLGAADFLAVLDAAQSMPPEELNPLLVGLIADLDGGAGGAGGGGPRLFLTGAVLDEPRVAGLIDELGARVAGDDLCSGSRHFAGRVGAEGEPLAALVEHALRRPPCACKHDPARDPGAALVEQARAVGADGVVFLLEKFCDPHAFDRALSLRALDAAGLPHLLLELEHSAGLEALRTRLQAFVEML